MKPRDYWRRMTARSEAQERARTSGHTDRQRLEEYLAKFTRIESDSELAQRFQVTKLEVRRRREAELARRRVAGGDRRLHPELRVSLGLQA